MAEDYQRFLDFDWSDERWQSYLNGLYPPPSHTQLLKFKKKWYKKNIDPVLDDAHEPPTAATSSASSAGAGHPGAAGGRPCSAPPPFPSGTYADGRRWAVMGKKATICFVAYAVSLTMVIGSIAAVFPAYQALIVLVSAFILEILAKYGLKFKSEYLHFVLLDDVDIAPIMAVTLLTPGLHPVLRTLALVPPSTTALLSFSQICKHHSGLPTWVRDFFAPLAEPGARFQVMQLRAHLEVALGFILIAGVFAARAAPFSALLFWNFMMMRYMMSSWTQASFANIDGTLSPVLGRVPGVKLAYAALKRRLYSFVDPESRRAGRLCTIL